MTAVREVEISARFPRVVTFVYEKDPHWIDTVQRIIEIYTVMWGGYNWLIVPFDIRDRRIYVNEVFRSLVRNYDPDIVWVYSPSFLDVEMANKRSFKEMCIKYKKEYEKHGIDISDTQVIADVRNSPYKGNSCLFQSEKFYFPFFRNVSKTSKPKVTYVKLIEDINFSSIRWSYKQLLVENDFFSDLIRDGKINNYIFYLKDKFLNTVMYAITGKLPLYDINGMGLEGKRPLSSIKNLLREKSRYVTYDAIKSKFRNRLSLDDFIAEFLSYEDKYPIKKERELIYNAYNEPLYVILGDGDLKSFLVYFNLLRLGYLALYLPKKGRDDYSRNILKGILRAHYNKRIFLITASDGSDSEFIRGLIDKYSVDDALFKLAKDKAGQLSFHEFALEDVFRKEDFFKSLEQWRLIYINEFLIQKSKKELYLNFYSIDAMLSRIPYVNHANVILEFKVRDLPFLQKEVFLERIFLEEFKRYFHFSRVDSKGRIAIWFQTLFVPIGNLPFLKNISPENYFRYFFSQDSQELKISDKGVFSKLFFTNAKVHYGTLLKKVFLSKFRWIIPSFLVKAKENVSHYNVYFPNSEIIEAIKNKDCGLGLVVKEKERAIFSLQDFEKLNFFFSKERDESYRKKSIEFLKKFRSLVLAPEDNELRDHLNFMMENNILEEGLFLECNHCSQSWFYTFSEFDENNQFRCIYCRKKQKLELSNHRDKFPLIFFSITDYIYKLFKQNGDLVLMTLLWIFKKYNPQNLIWSGELKYSDKFEVDLIAVTDGKLLLAECKKSDDGFRDIGRKFSKFEKVIEFFDPSVIVLSSFDKSDTNMNEVAKKISSLFPEKKLEILTESDFKSLWK